MTDFTTRSRAPWWFWAIAIAVLLWNIFGVSQYLAAMSATPESLIESGYYTQEQADVMSNIPAWSVSLFALAVFSGLAGAVLLLLRKAVAASVFLLNLVFVILSTIGDAVLGLFSIMGGSYIGLMTMVVLASVLQWLFSRAMRNKNILT